MQTKGQPLGWSHNSFIIQGLSIGAGRVRPIFCSWKHWLADSSGPPTFFCLLLATGFVLSHCKRLPQLYEQAAPCVPGQIERSDRLQALQSFPDNVNSPERSFPSQCTSLLVCHPAAAPRVKEIKEKTWLWRRNGERPPFWGKKLYWLVQKPTLFAGSRGKVHYVLNIYSMMADCAIRKVCQLAKWELPRWSGHGTGYCEFECCAVIAIALGGATSSSRRW